MNQIMKQILILNQAMIIMIAMLKWMRELQFLCDLNIIKNDINIDGVFLVRSSKLKIWPIHGAFVDQLDIFTFLIGCYQGFKADVEDFLLDFVNELSTILQHIH